MAGAFIFWQKYYEALRQFSDTIVYVSWQSINLSNNKIIKNIKVICSLNKIFITD